METNLLIELGDIDGYFIWLLVVLELVEAYFVLDNLAEKERQELFMVLSLGKVFAEALKESNVNKASYGCSWIK